ncbi:MAG: rhomboid family intramembrane serine protease [Lentisphaeria bacterium]|nr:rhomboid family intramembrane serine protease [Lentisphaeria bacterium]
MGLYERNYMNEPRENYSSGRRAMWWLIAINVFVYFFVASPGDQRYITFALHASECSMMTPVQFLTSGFLHGNFSHLLFNMYGLYLFGSIASPILGEKRFCTLYLAGIIISSGAFYLINLGKPLFLVGASGAICAVTIAAAMVDPEKRFIMIFMPFTPIKITTMVICYTILNFLMSVGDAGNSISYLAHLAGFIGGYILMKLIAPDCVLWDPLKLKNRSGKTQTPPPPKKPVFRRKPESDSSTPVSNAELDMLLDKISREGINSLSEHELARLRQARKEMRGE